MGSRLSTSARKRRCPLVLYALVLSQWLRFAELSCWGHLEPGPVWISGHPGVEQMRGLGMGVQLALGLVPLSQTRDHEVL
jgi:hypothetical protein